MKKIIILMVLNMLSVFMVNAGNVNVKVKLNNIREKHANIQIGYKIYNIDINKDGEGCVDIDVRGETFAYFSCKYTNVDLYIVEGKDMEISIDYDRKDGREVIYDCDDKGANEYLAGLSHSLFFEYKNNKLKEEDFFIKVDELLNNRLKELKEKSFSKRFKKAQKYNLVYTLAKNIAEYPRFHARSDKDYKPSDKYYKRLKSLVKDKSKFLSLNSYREFMYKAIKVLAKKDINSDDDLGNAVEAIKIASDLEDQAFKDYLIYFYTKGYVYYSSTKRNSELVKLFNANVKDKEKIEDIDILLNNWSKIGKGQPSPKFNFEDINGKMVSLDDLKGKYVYIDCWSTGCGYCIQQFPYLEKLEKEYEGRNIYFVSISSDRSKKMWEHKVKKDNLGGIQLFIGKDNSFHEAYNIHAIPRFILLDKEGNIIDADAPRPSDKKIRCLFNCLKDL